MLEPTLRAHDLAEEVRRLFLELERAHGFGCREVAAEFAPAIDVYETSATYEICVDVPGVSRDAIRLLIKGQMLIIAGEKWPGGAELAAGLSFQQVERSFGRFARGVRFTNAIDAGRARATLSNGELSISVPKVDERRGLHLEIRID